MNTVEQQYEPAMAVAGLSQHPDNPRRGNDEVVSESVEANGFYGAVIVQKSTGFVLAGNTRLRVAQETGSETIPAIVVDCDDAAAKRILLADNRTADLATYDDKTLRTLLSLVADEGGLLGTGYTDADLTLLLGSTSQPFAAPDDFPTIDPSTMEVEHQCPSCGYEWSGRPSPNRPTHLPDDE